MAAESASAPIRGIFTRRARCDGLSSMKHLATTIGILIVLAVVGSVVTASAHNQTPRGDNRGDNSGMAAKDAGGGGGW